MQVKLRILFATLLLLSACDLFNSEQPETLTEEYFRADINGETFVQKRMSTPSDHPFASIIMDEGRQRLSFMADSLSFPYKFYTGFSLFPPEGTYDTTYTLQSDIYDFENAYASVAELDWDVFISRFYPVEGEENILNIRNSIMDDGRMLVEGSFYMTMTWDTSYQNSGSVVVDSQLPDTLTVTDGSFRLVVKDLRR